jgi:hypothetical protein
MRALLYVIMAAGWAMAAYADKAMRKPRAPYYASLESDARQRQINYLLRNLRITRRATPNRTPLGLFVRASGIAMFVIGMLVLMRGANS